jgi:hypothetical protein
MRNVQATAWAAGVCVHAAGAVAPAAPVSTSSGEGVEDGLSELDLERLAQPSA